jgi:hypothetical protein
MTSPENSSSYWYYNGTILKFSRYDLQVGRFGLSLLLTKRAGPDLGRGLCMIIAAKIAMPARMQRQPLGTVRPTWHQPQPHGNALQGDPFKMAIAETPIQAPTRNPVLGRLSFTRIQIPRARRALCPSRLRVRQSQGRDERNAAQLLDQHAVSTAVHRRAVSPTPASWIFPRLTARDGAGGRWPDTIRARL